MRARESAEGAFTVTVMLSLIVAVIAGMLALHFWLVGLSPLWWILLGPIDMFIFCFVAFTLSDEEF